MRVVFGTDEDGPLPQAIVEHLVSEGHSVFTVAGGQQWPDVGAAVAQAVVSGAAQRGVVCCWTGTGVSIAANKVRGARAALCTDAATAAGARRWNDANVLAIGLRLTSAQVASEMIDAFLTTPVDDSESAVIGRMESG